MSDAMELASFVTTDLCAITRGRAVAAQDLDKALARGLGWVPANLALTPQGEIAEDTPFGSSGDLRLAPDPEARIRVEIGGRTPLHFYHSDITALDGTPWDCCVRSLLKSALADLEEEFGLRLTAAFEHEFQIFGAGWIAAAPFSLAAARRADAFGPRLVGLLEAAGCAPETFLPEYGTDQYEIVCAPAPALAAADRAVSVREITRELAASLGWRASFAPKTAPEAIGNGVHIHFSLTESDGTPATYDPDRPGRMSERAARFAAGIVAHMPALAAFAAPSAVSSLRLQPHHWAASWTTLGEHDREATLRICPTSQKPGYDPSRAFNLEFRAADATASPHLALALLVRAGMEGLRRGFEPAPITRGDPGAMSPAARAAAGIARLPATPAEGLAAIVSDPVLCAALAPDLLACYLGLRRKEQALTADLDEAALCARYAEIY
ncbi:glutamine synthetase [Acidimangrovimonas pyrenivorans]|uniref:Glutamine synthetase n=1 Tax=Acidimangrovimonas pyrenivorans TaxID=2030798 RepID=A0ABV7AI63_9RHOB